MLEDNEYVGPKVIARWFLNHADRDAGEALTHLKIQKLVYYAQAWFLANFDRPIFEEELEAWAHGPVSRSIFEKYRGNSWQGLPPEKGKAPPAELCGFLSAVFDEYGQFSAKRLEKMTHEETPWVEARGKLPPEAKCSTPISKLTMRNYYASKIGKEKITELPN